MTIYPTYPDTGPLAVLARVMLLCAIAGIAAVSLAPASLVPRLVYSYHTEHFGAFYALATVASAAAQRRSLSTLCIWLSAFAGATELARILPTAHRLYNSENLACDILGVLLGTFAVAVGQFRVRFSPPAPAKAPSD